MSEGLSSTSLAWLSHGNVLAALKPMHTASFDKGAFSSRVFLIVAAAAAGTQVWTFELQVFEIHVVAW